MTIDSRSLLTFLALTTLPAFGCGAEDPGPGDPQPLTFSQLRVEEISHNRAVMRGDTSMEATCAVEYGLSMDNLQWTATDPEMAEGEFAVNHQVPLEDLTPNTTYYLRALAEGPGGELGASEIITFATLPDPGTDPTNDLVNIALREQGTTVTEVSSNWSNGDNDSAYGAHKAIDGMETTEWSTNGDGNDAWMRLDLGQERTITHFAYRSRMMSDGTSIVTRVQLVLEDQADRVLGPYETPDHTIRYVFELPEPVTTQHVRFEAVETTGGNTGAREIQLFEQRPL